MRYAFSHSLPECHHTPQYPTFAIVCILSLAFSHKVPFKFWANLHSALTVDNGPYYCKDSRSMSRYMMPQYALCHPCAKIYIKSLVWVVVPGKINPSSLNPSLYLSSMLAVCTYSTFADCAFIFYFFAGRENL